MLNKDYSYLLPDLDNCRLCKIGPVCASNWDVHYGKYLTNCNPKAEFPAEYESLFLEQNIVWDDASIDPDQLSKEKCGGIVINDLNKLADTIGQKSNRLLNQILDSCGHGENCETREAAFVYVGARNKIDYQQIIRPILAIGNYWKKRNWINKEKIISILEKHDYRQIHAFPILQQEGGVEEIVFGSRYKSKENTFGLKERIKEFMLGRWGLDKFATGHGILACRTDADSFLVLLLAEIRSALPDQEQPDGAIHIHRFLSMLLPRKVIMTTGTKRKEKWVIIISYWERVSERRERESSILLALDERKLSKYAKSPKFYLAGKWRGARYHVIEAIEGVTIDIVQPGLSQLAQRVLAHIYVFHNKTLGTKHIDEAGYEQVFGWIFRTARSKYGNNNDILEKIFEIDDLVKKAVMGGEVRVAWMHGDYKIENVIFDKNTGEINGVIDWEHSRECGWPFVDLWYLLVYNRQIQTGEDFYRTSSNMCFQGDLSEWERESVNKYIKLLGYDHKLSRIMTGLFVLHHIICRMTYNLDDVAIHTMVSNALVDTQRFLRA